MRRVHALEARLKEQSSHVEPLSNEQQQRLRTLGHDLHSVWNHPEASNDLKKRILRTVVEEIIVRADETQRLHIVNVHWKGGVHTELRVQRNGKGQHRRVADEKVLALVEELSKVCEDKTIAQVLNRLGYLTGQGNTWHVHHVQSFRYTRGLANYKHQGDWLSLEETARTLQVSNTVVKHLIQAGVLPAKQVVPCAPWIIERASLELPAVVSRIRAVHEGRKLHQVTPEQQELPLNDASPKGGASC
jgi:hypothetical protein